MHKISSEAAIGFTLMRSMKSAGLCFASVIWQSWWSATDVHLVTVGC